MKNLKCQILNPHENKFKGFVKINFANNLLGKVVLNALKSI